MAREKRRNSEKRKEKSRDAARCRRSKETEIFTDLSQCLPLSESVVSQLDKASIMRLAISLLKMGDVLDSVGITGNNDDNNNNNSITQSDDAWSNVMQQKYPEAQDQALSDEQTYQLHLKALEGTVFILSSDGDLVYMTENVSKYLGLQQIEMMGQSIYDYIHPCDHEEMKNALSMKGGHTNDTPIQQNTDASPVYSEIRTLLIRLKCTLTTKGRSVNIKSAPYKVMKCFGRLVSGNLDDSQKDSGLSKPYLLAMMEPIPHPSNIEVPLDSSTFLSKHEMDMSFIFCDDRIEELAGYDHTAMVGQSFYGFHHALDADAIKKTFKDLYSKGQAITPPYRMLVANGGYMWVMTEATLINNSRYQKPESVVCVHYVLSGVEERGVVLSSIQEDLTLSTPPVCVLPDPPMKREVTSPEVLVVDDLTKLDFLPPKLELNTEHIFAPKIKETDSKELINSPKMTFYDLEYLSPTAGDDKTNELFNDYNRDFLNSPMLSMPTSPLDRMRTPPGVLSPDQSVENISSQECSRTASPADFMNCMMPMEMDSIEKFFAPLNGGGKADGGDGIGMTPTNAGIPDMSPPAVPDLDDALDADEDLPDIDFAMRAPYIPMDGDQDLNLLPPSTAMLFNLSSDDINPIVFERTESVFGPKQGLFQEPDPLPKMSLRNMLDESTAVASIEQPVETDYLQMKRPLDMNCLEKGPPAPKVARLGKPITLLSAPRSQPCQTSGKKNSVLLNLLLTGEDNSYGYKVCQKAPTVQTANTAKPRQCPAYKSFETLSSQDCEVNAPIPSCKLLQGQDLLNALDN